MKLKYPWAFSKAFNDSPIDIAKMEGRISFIALQATSIVSASKPNFINKDSDLSPIVKIAIHMKPIHISPLVNIFVMFLGEEVPRVLLIKMAITSATLIIRLKPHPFNHRNARPSPETSTGLFNFPIKYNDTKLLLKLNSYVRQHGNIDFMRFV